MNKESNKVVQDPEAGGPKKSKAGAFKVLLRIFVQAFTMTFVAEWGDRSQITTIILSARENLMGVITGGIIGHAICTGLGVLGGRMIAQKISVRTGKIIRTHMIVNYFHYHLTFSDPYWRRSFHSLCYNIIDLGSE